MSNVDPSKLCLRALFSQAVQDGAVEEVAKSKTLKELNGDASLIIGDLQIPSQSLRLFGAATLQTSIAVRGRWTPEYRVIKTALLGQIRAYNKVCRPLGDPLEGVSTLPG